MNFFERRRWKKQVEQLVNDARHARNMKADVSTQEQLDRLDASVQSLRQAWKNRDEDSLGAASARVSECIAAIFPPVRFPRIRENVEVIVVALAVAMAFRTYFIQPFKIPTGSMQPTLYGITVKPQLGKKAMDRFPLNLVHLALFGERYTEVHAAADGKVVYRPDLEEEERHVIQIGDALQRIPRGLNTHFSFGDQVARGDLLASGRLVLGDHIFVNKVRYNFSRPKRGDIIVFSTDRINYQRIRPNSFYIKRLAGLPNETISIDPPYLVADGVRITEPSPFERLLNARDQGYNGYAFARPQADAPAFLWNATSTLKLGPQDFLPLGDNTLHSLDGRYFGPVRASSLVGPAFVVYWPLSRRWGLTQ